ncbi:MAG: oxygenase MpaB family protein [Gordonia sp. (in: high G+C Gram-positive bacteria)]|uniref:oxygenase MpaB family protein n=1 Tax=Gordonia sp. (in: high G+C Gram-positive bacteria) TaxID=84139 RepID=UPI0039E4F028
MFSPMKILADVPDALVGISNAVTELPGVITRVSGALTKAPSVLRMLLPTDGEAARENLSVDIPPALDDGFFGPGSVTWKVWSYPSSIVVGFARAVTIEQLDPNLNAAVEGTGDVRARTRTRYERTMRYFALAAFGASYPAAKAADVLVRVHSKAIGVDPVTGGHYDANNPYSQLWIHMTAWHSILYCYEVFGPGRLSEAEELQYWAECARAAELTTVDPAEVPRTREDVIAYFEEWRPRLAASENAQTITDHILRSGCIFPDDVPGWFAFVQPALVQLIRAAIVSTYPHYIRNMLDQKQSGVTDVVVRRVMKAVLQMVNDNINLYVALGDVMVPTTMEVAGHALIGLPAEEQVTMTPREAQRKYGFDDPSEAHEDFRRMQAERVFGLGQAPSNEGLEESEQLIGAR